MKLTFPTCFDFKPTLIYIFIYFEMQKAFHVKLSHHACVSDCTGDSVRSVETCVLALI